MPHKLQVPRSFRMGAPFDSIKVAGVLILYSPHSPCAIALSPTVGSASTQRPTEYSQISLRSVGAGTADLQLAGLVQTALVPNNSPVCNCPPRNLCNMRMVRSARYLARGVSLLRVSQRMTRESTDFLHKSVSGVLQKSITSLEASLTGTALT